MGTVFSGSEIGVSSGALTSGSGLTGPSLLSAASVGPNGVRLTFDRDMRMETGAGAFLGGTLNADSYHIRRLSDSAKLWILAVVPVDSTHVDLVTEDQLDVSYEVKALAGGAEDVWGNEITEQTEEFTGTLHTGYPEPTTIGVFSSVIAGMQEDPITDFWPDITAPYLANRDPAPLDTGVDKDKIVSLDILDDESPLVLASIEIYVEGSLAYQGSTDSFLAPYNGPGSVRTPVALGHNFTIDKTVSYGSLASVSVRAVAQDDATNWLDQTYSFTIEDYEGPTFHNNSPTGTGVSRTSAIYFEMRDSTQVDQATLDVTVGGQSAIFHGVFQSGWSGSIVPNVYNGYDVTLNRTGDHPSFAELLVDIYVEDTDGNPGTFNWSFRVEDYLGPLIIPVSPTSGQFNVPIDSHIVIRMTDEDAVVQSSILVEVNIDGGGYVTAYSGVTGFQPGWDGPESALTGADNDRYLTIDQILFFPEDITVEIRVTAQDPTGNNERI
jgi:hypothetical protein